ncbi:MAG TPA: hypothetical protein PK466_15035, partial [Thermotogota bacterium]|nr:hypothetical protein [Thermotogota bacterium]
IMEPPTIPTKLERDERNLSWKASKDPEGTLITYTIYLWEFGKEKPHILISNLTNTQYNHYEDFDETKTYKWYVVATDKDGKIAKSEINMFGNVEPQYQLTVQAVPPEGGTVTGTGNFKEGVAVNLTATPNSGYIFKEWQASSGVLHDPSSEDTLFTMPGEDSIVSAHFERTGTLILSGHSTWTGETVPTPIMPHPRNIYDISFQVSENATDLRLYFGQEVVGATFLRPDNLPATDLLFEDIVI